MDDLPDSPKTTISEVVGPSEALEQESASRQATTEVHQQRAEASNRKAGLKTGKTKRPHHEAKQPQQNIPFQHAPRPYHGYQGNTAPPTFQTQPARQVPHFGRAPQQQWQLAMHPTQSDFQPRIETQRVFNSKFPTKQPFQPTWQPFTAFPLQPATMPLPMTHKGYTRSAAEDAYDRSRGAYFSNLPPKVEMRMAEPKMGFGEITRNQITSMRAEFAEVDARDQTVSAAASIPQHEDAGKSTPVLEELKKQEGRLRGLEEGLGRLEEKIDRILELLEGAPGPTMEEGEVEGWWKEVKERE